MTVVKSPTLSKTHMSFDCLYSLIVIDIEINYSRLMMPLALSRGILLRPRSERVEKQLSLFVSMEACRFVYILPNRRP